jgi:putative sugar O-methyltransferase
MEDRLELMFDGLSTAPVQMLPSAYWEELNNNNLSQLEQFGYENFKRTLALNYFTWLTLRTALNQIGFCAGQMPITSWCMSVARALTGSKHNYFSWKQSIIYNLLTYVVWGYSVHQDRQGVTERLAEPTEGNPPRTHLHGKLISQDLANSVLEYLSIVVDSDNHAGDIQSIMELGAGYGRTAYVFLKLMPDVKYVVVDIPPALYVSERYLSSQFPEKRIFKFRPFTGYADIEDELSHCQIAFFLPNQLELLPDKMFDLCINISSLHEMRLDQIDFYLRLIDRLTRRFFYMKQWKVSRIPFENIVITEKDYPIPSNWTIEYWRETRVQTKFFEAFMKIGDTQTE